MITVNYIFYTLLLTFSRTFPQNNRYYIRYGWLDSSTTYVKANEITSEDLTISNHITNNRSHQLIEHFVRINLRFWRSHEIRKIQNTSETSTNCSPKEKHSKFYAYNKSVERAVFWITEFLSGILWHFLEHTELLTIELSTKDKIL